MNFLDGPTYTGSFDPATVTRLHQAFTRAWNFVKASGEVALKDEESARASLALHVVEIGRSGEDNVLKLTNLAIARFRQYHKTSVFKNKRTVNGVDTTHTE
jgi:hypothetical protein